jgi:3-oxoacyl-[acyl-carrier protein] reductase
VKAFLDEGAIVHFCSRTQADIHTATESLSGAYPGRVMATTVDVSNQQALSSWVLSCAEQSNGIDVVVSNVSALLMDDTVECWTSTFNTDMLALVTLVNTSLPFLEKSKGSVIAISSVSGRDVDFTAPGPYGALKASIVHYVAQLAHTLAPRGVRANTVSPGNIYIEDGVWGGIEKSSPDLFKNQLAKNPMGRMGKGEEIADSVLFLASERASFVSGTNLTVDGALCTGVQL